MRHFYFLIVSIGFALSTLAITQARAQEPTSFPNGEKLTYNVSFAAFADAGYVELHALARDKSAAREFNTVRARVRTNGIVQATLLNIDHEGTVFLHPESNLPQRVERNLRADDKPVEFRRDFAENQTISDSNVYDLVSALYQIRRLDFASNQIHTIKIQENDRLVEVKLQAAKRVAVSTAIGAFNAFVVQARAGDDAINRLKIKIYLSDDERRVPVLINFRLPQGEVRAELASLQNVLPESVAPTIEQPIAVVQPTPVVAPTARPVVPRPTPTPKPYVENQPLAPELPFALGEKLSFEVFRGADKIGNVNLEVKERKLFNGRDSVRLTATAQPFGNSNLLQANNRIESQIDPDYLTPFRHEKSLTGALAAFNQTLVFDQNAGAVTDQQNVRVEAPVGTHDILSFVYALRAFRFYVLERNSQDTRAAVFLGSAPTIVTLRPTRATVDFAGKKINALALTAATGNPQIDSLALRLWLSDDQRRLPLKLTFNTPQGIVTANLISF